MNTLFDNIEHQWVVDTSFKSNYNVIKRFICIDCTCFMYQYYYVENGLMKVSSYIMNYNVQNSSQKCLLNVCCINCNGYNTTKLYYTKCNNCSLIKNGLFNKKVLTNGQV